MKFVLDTNVLIAAFISSGTCHEILEHVIRNHELALSDFIVKFHLSNLESLETLMMIILLLPRFLPNAIAYLW